MNLSFEKLSPWIIIGGLLLFFGQKSLASGASVTLKCVALLSSSSVGPANSVAEILKEKRERERAAQEPQEGIIGEFEKGLEIEVRKIENFSDDFSHTEINEKRPNARYIDDFFRSRKEELRGLSSQEIGKLFTLFEKKMRPLVKKNKSHLEPFLSMSEHAFLDLVRDIPVDSSVPG